MTGTPEIAPPAPRVQAAVLVALASVTFAVYARTLFCGFVYYDDGLYVFDNEFVRNGVTLAGLRHILTTGETGTWQPLALLSHTIDCQMYGLAAWGHHLTSIVFHAANAVLLAIALARLTGRFYLGAAVAATFALHPAHVESVAWIAERKDVLSTFFWVLCLIAYERYARRGGAARYAAVCALLALGLMAKPMLVTVPCVLLLLDYWPLRRMDRGVVRLLTEKAPLFALAAASSAITLIVQRHNQAIVSLENLPLDQRLANVAVSYVNYIALMVWPTGLAIDYPHPRDTLTAVRIAASCAVLAAVTIALLAARKRAPYALVGWSWYLGTLVPVIGFVHVGEQGMADRYTYVPSIGLAIAAVWSIAALVPAGHRSPAARAATAAFLCVALPAWSLATWKQIAHWRDTEALWVRAADVNPAHERAQRNLGAIYLDRGEWVRAVPRLEAAAQLNPSDPRTFHNLGYALLRIGNPGAALERFARAAQLDPSNADTRNSLGVCLLHLGRDAEAVTVLRDATRLDIRDAVVAADLASNLGVALLKTGEVDEAVALLRGAVAQHSQNAKLRNTFGIALNAAGQRDGAIGQFREALRIDPANTEAQRNLAALGG